MSLRQQSVSFADFVFHVECAHCGEHLAISGEAMMRMAPRTSIDAADDPEIAAHYEVCRAAPREYASRLDHEPAKRREPSGEHPTGTLEPARAAQPELVEPELEPEPEPEPKQQPPHLPDTAYRGG